MNRLALKNSQYERRKNRVNKKVHSSDLERKRLCITRSNTSIYAQIIDDLKGHTLVAVSTLSKEFDAFKSRKNIQSAEALGKSIAEKAKAAGIKKVYFDRNGYLYHGKIKAFAEAARENGLDF